MTFTCRTSIHAEHQYIKDSRGYIVGSIYPQGNDWWTWQSCDNTVTRPDTSRSNPSTPVLGRQEAIDTAIADYVARKME